MADTNLPTTTKQKPPLRAGGAVMAIIPQDIDQVWNMAKLAVMGRMAPESLVKGKSIEDATAACAIAILAGAELGLSPMTALRSYAVVNGRPSLWGDGIKAVVRQSGKCAFIRAGGDLEKGWCEAKRSDTDEEMRREFTWEQAKKAKLSGKAGPWQEYPDMMMERRATFRCLNDLFADVLGGLGDSMDPIEEAAAPARIDPPDVPEEPAPPTTKEINLNATETKASTAARAEEEINAGDYNDDASGVTQPDGNRNVAAFLTRIDEELSTVADAPTIEEVFDGMDVQTALAGDDDALARAFDIKKKHLDRVEVAETVEAGQTDMFSPPDVPE